MELLLPPNALRQRLPDAQTLDVSHDTAVVVYLLGETLDQLSQVDLGSAGAHRMRASVRRLRGAKKHGTYRGGRVVGGNAEELVQRHG